MYISPYHRGKGNIQLLLDAIQGEMKNDGGLELRLYVHRSNRTAIRAYEKVGFKKSDYEVMIVGNH